MTIELKSYTVAELHAYLQTLIERGQGYLPVVATDCRARYPFQLYTVSNASGYPDALLINVRPDAHFETRLDRPMHWSDDCEQRWNTGADIIKARAGAFA